MTTRELVELLESLGRLPSDFDPAPLLGLVDHPVEEVRLYAVKNLAKLKQPRLLQFFFEHGRQEPSTLFVVSLFPQSVACAFRRLFPASLLSLRMRTPKLYFRRFVGC